MAVLVAVMVVLVMFFNDLLLTFDCFCLSFAFTKSAEGLRMKVFEYFWG